MTAPRLNSHRARRYVPAAQDTSEAWRGRFECYKRAVMSREEQLRDGWRRRHPVSTTEINGVPRASRQ